MVEFELTHRYRFDLDVDPHFRWVLKNFVFTTANEILLVDATRNVLRFTLLDDMSIAENQYGKYSNWWHVMNLNFVNHFYDCNDRLSCVAY